MENKQTTKRQEQALNTKNKIYKTAIALMEKKGYANITVEEISKAAGVSIGGFYHYYKSKSDIFFEIYKNADDYFRNYVAPQINGDHPIEQIVQYFCYYARYNQSAGIDTVKLLYNPDNKWFIQKGRFIQSFLENMIDLGQRKEAISRDMSPEEITDYLFIAARGVVYHWCLNDGSYNLEDYINTYFSRLITIFKND